MTTPIDLRSDTVTRPTAAMRRAMAEADVGDDWYGDDPTVNRLQDRCAELTGKDAGLYVATGTMANQIAIHGFVRSGHLLACEATSHVTNVEVISSAVLSGVAFLPIPGSRGRLPPEAVASALEPDPYGVEVVDLLSLEDTHQVGGGTVSTVDDLRALRKTAQEAGVPVYLDGARLFNAAEATGAPVGEFAAEADAVMLSLSKGLGAPIGSVLCGPSGFMEEARRTRILFGGAWRQAGIMAAAGLVALEEGPAQLAQDHANAARLAQGLAEATPEAVDPASVETNIVFADVSALDWRPFDVLGRLREAGVLANVVAGRIRFVTHRDVTADDMDAAVAVWARLAQDLRRDGAEG